MKRKNINIQTDLKISDYERILSQEMVALDTETTGINPNRDILCLVQLCDPAGNVDIIKTKNWEEIPILRKLFSNNKITKVMHFALFDSSIILKYTGINMQNVYCTKVSSKIARTYSPSHSLSTIVKEFFDVDLNKKEQSSDWLKPELTTEQLEYAANDVIWLLEIRSILQEILNRKGNLPSGISYLQLNQNVQSFIPNLVQLSINGWDFGREDPNSIFSHH